MVSHLLLLVASQGHWVISQKSSSLGSGAQSQVSPGDGASFDACAVSRTFSQGKWPRGLPRNRAWGSCRSLARLRGGVGFPGLPYKVPHGGWTSGLEAGSASLGVGRWVPSEAVRENLPPASPAPGGYCSPCAPWRVAASLHPCSIFAWPAPCVHVCVKCPLL